MQARRPDVVKYGTGECSRRINRSCYVLAAAIQADMKLDVSDPNEEGMYRGEAGGDPAVCIEDSASKARFKSCRDV